MVSHKCIYHLTVGDCNSVNEDFLKIIRKHLLCNNMFHVLELSALGAGASAEGAAALDPQQQQQVPLQFQGEGPLLAQARQQQQPQPQEDFVLPPIEV